MKRKIATICVLLLINIAGSVYSQPDVKIDSLKKQRTGANDTTRIKISLEIAHQFLRLNTDSALSYAMKAKDESVKTGFNRGEALAYRELGSVYYNKGEMPEAEKIALLALEKLSSVGTLVELSEVTNLLGLICMTQAKYYQSEEYFKESLFQSINCKDSIGVVIALHNIGVVNFYRGDYDKVARYYDRSLRLAETLKNKKFITVNLLNLGILYSAQKDFARAKRSIKSALLNYRIVNDVAGIAGTMAHLGTVYFNEGYMDSSLASHEKSLELYKEVDNENGIAQCMSNIGDIYVHNGNFLKGKEYYLGSLELRKKNEDNYGLSISYMGLANANYGIGNSKDAQLYFDSALVVSESIGSVGRTAEIYESMSAFQERQGNYRLAYESLRNYTAIRDTLFSREKIEVVRELEAKYQNEKTIKDLEIQKGKVTILKRANGLFIFSLIALAVIVVLIVLLGRTRRKRIILSNQKNLEIAEKNRLLAESQQKTMEAELQRSKLEQEKMAAELQFKKKELTQLALHINQQNDFLESLKNNIKELSVTPEVKSLERELDAKLNLDKQREDFELNIDLINEDFYRKLSERFPLLSENEKKLCAMIRLNLSSKEIAAIQNISSKSVDMNRYRMRKKLNITGEEDLNKFLSEL
jgi:tetratricopeptide (TPR) repeat protein